MQMLSMVPGLGEKLFEGSSALIRHSIETTLAFDLVLCEGEFLARRDFNLLLDQIDSSDHF